MTRSGPLTLAALLTALLLGGCAPQSGPDGAPEDAPAEGATPASASARLPDDGFVDVPGGRVAFRTWGSGDGVPLLVVHGGPGSTSCIYPSTFDGVAATRPVVTYDQLGSGHSDRTADTTLYRLPRFVEELQAVRDGLGLDEVHLAGHSWGSAVVLEYLLTTEAEGVRSAVFMGPFFGTERWIEDAKVLVETLPEDVQAAIWHADSTGNFDTPEFAAANEAFLAEFGVRSGVDTGELPACAATPPAGFDVYGHMWGPSEFLSTGTLREYDRTDRIGELADVGVPVLFVAGEYDEARPETVREYQAQVPGSEVAIIPDAGHVMNVDAPEAFNRAVADFLAEVEGR